MKNRKYSKIIVLALSLALLVGAKLCVAANAESTPEILAKNIEYGDTLKFMIAVDPATVGGEGTTVTFSVYEGNPDDNGRLLGTPAVAEYQNTSATNLGVDYAYVATASCGVSPLAYGENYYLVAECDGAKSVVQYSVVEYFLERLYVDGIAKATEGEELLQKSIYENAIAYGSSVQKYAAFEGKFNGTIVEDYRYVSVEGGTANGIASGVFAKGTTVTLSANAKGWQATTASDGVTAKIDGTSYTVNDNVLINTYVRPLDLAESYYATKKAAGETVIDYNGLAFWKLCVRNGSATLKALDFSNQMSDYVNHTYLIPATVDGRSVYELGKEPSNHTIPEVAFYNLNSTDKNCVVFESDVMLHVAESDQITAARQYFSRFGFMSNYNRGGNYDGGNSVTAKNMIHYAEVSGAFDTEANAWKELKYNNQSFESDVWYRIAMEYYKAEGVIKYYVDGYLIATVEVEANLECNNAVFQLQGQAHGSRIYFDNTYMGTVDKHIAK